MPSKASPIVPTVKHSVAKRSAISAGLACLFNEERELAVHPETAIANRNRSQNTTTSSYSDRDSSIQHPRHPSSASRRPGAGFRVSCRPCPEWVAGGKPLVVSVFEMDREKPGKQRPVGEETQLETTFRTKQLATRRRSGCCLQGEACPESTMFGRRRRGRGENVEVDTKVTGAGWMRNTLPRFNYRPL